MQVVSRYRSVFHHTDWRIAYDHYRPQQPIASLLFCHGVLEHRQRYQTMFDYLAGQGVEIIIMDQPGHGETGPILGHLPCALAKVASLQAQLFTTYADPDVPHFLAGHSMGTMVATRLALQADHPWRALILCSPPSPDAWQWLAATLLKPLVPVLGSWRHPWLHALAFAKFDRPFAGEGLNAWLSSDLSVGLAAAKDPLMAPLASLATLQQLAANVATVFQPASLAGLVEQLPIALFFGDADPVGSMGKGPLVVAERLASLGHPVDQFCYSDARHELMHELQAKAFYRDFYSYLHRQLSD